MLHSPVRAAAKTGILLINLGTPDDATPRAVRRYLDEFLSDRRVVELPRLVWQPILHGFVLRTRPRKTAHAYQQIWDGGSPLANNTQAQAERLAEALGPGVVVDFAMRYGNPSIAHRLKAMTAAGCERILLAPLYPQYSAATTATALDKCYDALKTMRAGPAIRTLPPYQGHPAYIEALRTSVRDGLEQLDFRPDVLVASFHGMPERTEALGDPYRSHCIETTERLANALGHPVEISFQSQFGPAKWFSPSTERILTDLPKGGAKRVAVITPGFSADCIETLEEIAMRGQETFLAAGGERFAYIPCLNATDAGMEMLVQILETELRGWLDVNDHGRAKVPASAL